MASFSLWVHGLRPAMSNRSCCYLKSHFIIPLEAELEKCRASCWPRLPASRSSRCGRGMSSCQESVPTWEAAALRCCKCCRRAGVSNGGESSPAAQDGEPVCGKGSALLVARWKENICFLPRFCRNGIYRAVRAWQRCRWSLTGAAAQCPWAWQDSFTTNRQSIWGERGCRLCHPCGSGSAECLRSFLKLS